MSDRPRGRELRPGETPRLDDDDDEQDEIEALAGEWRLVGPNEVFAPGRSFRVNVTSGQTEVLVEPGDAPTTAASITTLSDLVSEPLWVAWRIEMRGDQGKEKPTKVPYNAPGRKAEADNPATWLTHDAAAAVADMIKSDLGSGIGIMLGAARIGVDLDCCRDPATGEIQPWAREVLDRLNTYAEVSPSGTGVKAFPLIDPTDIDALRTFMRTQHGRSWKRVNGSEHPPAIELYISNRYFAVTWLGLDDYPAELRPVSLDDLRWLIEEAGPALAGKATSAGGGDVDENILARLDRAAANNNALATALRNAATMKGGSRSEGAFGLGAALRRAGWSFEDMKAAMLACPATREWATEKLAEGNRQFERIWEKGAKTTRTPSPDDWPEPVDILADSDTGAPILTADHVPPALWPFIKDNSERMGVATSSVALSAIVTCSSVISDEWKVQPKRNDYLWTEEARLWGAEVGPPSVLKSPVIAVCTKPVEDLEIAARKAWRAAMEVHKAAEAAWKKGGKIEPKPEPPRAARYMVEDTSLEALQEVLRDDGKLYAPQGKVLVRRDELSEFLASMDRYSTSKSDQGAYLRLYNGGRHSIDRINRGPFVADSWSGCILGGIQPEVIQRIAGKADHDGLLQRFLFDVPAPHTGGGLDRAPDYPAIVAYRDLFPALVALHPARSGDASNRHVVVGLHADAHAAREDINTLAVVMAALPNVSKQLQSAFGKWPGTFARLCLTFHLIEAAAARVRNPGGLHPPLEVISADTAERVRRYMRAVLAPNLLRADATMFSSQQSEHATWVAGYILAGKLTMITAREIAKDYRALKAPEQRNVLDNTMLNLCMVGWLEAEEPSNPVKLPTRWRVNPNVHIRFAERAEAERNRREAVREAIARHVACLGSADIAA